MSRISHKYYNLNESQAFTLLEVLIVLGLLAILSSVAIFGFFGYQRKVALETSQSDIVNYLRFSQSKAITGEDADTNGIGDKWGVRFINSPTDDYYQVFYGNSYNSANVKEQVYLTSFVRFSDPVEGVPKDVIFEKSSGSTSTASITIYFTADQTQTKTISINSNGKISGN